MSFSRFDASLGNQACHASCVGRIECDRRTLERLVTQIGTRAVVSIGVVHVIGRLVVAADIQDVAGRIGRQIGLVAGKGELGVDLALIHEYQIIAGNGARDERILAGAIGRENRISEGGRSPLGSCLLKLSVRARSVIMAAYFERIAIGFDSAAAGVVSGVQQGVAHHLDAATLQCLGGIDAQCPMGFQDTRALTGITNLAQLDAVAVPNDPRRVGTLADGDVAVSVEDDLGREGAVCAWLQRITQVTAVSRHINADGAVAGQCHVQLVVDNDLACRAISRVLVGTLNCANAVIQDGVDYAARGGLVDLQVVQRYRGVTTVIGTALAAVDGRACQYAV